MDWILIPIFAFGIIGLFIAHRIDDRGPYSFTTLSVDLLNELENLKNKK